MRAKTAKTKKRNARKGITKDALAVLESPDFFGQLLAAFRRSGLVGEERNALVTYTVATSRLLDKPISLFIKGPSGIGKNFMADGVLVFLPPSEVNRAYALLRKAFMAGAIRRANRPTKGNLKTYLPTRARSFLPEPEEALRTLKGTPTKVRFVHPLTGKWVSYRR